MSDPPPAGPSDVYMIHQSFRREFGLTPGLVSKIPGGQDPVGASARQAWGGPTAKDQGAMLADELASLRSEQVRAAA
jgi:hypothetical protein